jgi:hypothetical protein
METNFREKVAFSLDTTAHQEFPNALTTKARKVENAKGRQLKFFNESIDGGRKNEIT